MKGYNQKRGGLRPSPKIHPMMFKEIRNQTVAIVGTHPITRDEAPFKNPAVDIWAFNGQALMDWCPRVSAVFDMHPTEDILQRADYDKGFGAWLKSEKGLPFYTPNPLPDCPGNVVYPKDEVVRDLLSHFIRNETTGPKVNAYFTSGPCYAIALAIHLGYRQIEMYGVEMENNTEYIYQRDGIALYVGIALGRGIKFSIDGKSMIFYAPLYGYEMDASKIDREAFEAKASELQITMEKTQSEYNRARGILDALQKQFIDLQTAVNEGKRDPKELEVIAKQYEEAQYQYEQSIANHAFVNGQYVDCQSWKARVEKVLEFNGKAQEVLAQRDEKSIRLADKLELTGRTLPNE